jgi:hypothetical protein
MRYLRTRIAALVLAAAAGTAGYAALAPVALAAQAAPAVVADGVVVNYQETGNWCAPGGGGPCTTHVTIVANPQNRTVRAFQQCSGGGYYTGGAKTSVGAESVTGSCAQGFYTGLAGFLYEQAQYQYNCYAHGDAWTGRCP